jgi:hypothetical protein
VACTFAAIGVVNDLFDLERSDIKPLLHCPAISHSNA